MKKLFSSLAVLSLITVSAPCAQAVVLAGWDFEAFPPSGIGSSGPVVQAGSGAFAMSSTATGSHASAATTWSNPSGNGSSESFSSNNWAIGDYYQFTSSTTGFEDIFISFDQTRSSTGPSDFTLQYSVDGMSFSNFTNYTVNEVTWGTMTSQAGSQFGPFDLSSVGALNNQPQVTFRLTAVSAPSSTAGTNRIDNVSISGTAVPEPTRAMLLSIAIGTLLMRRSRH